MSRKTTRHAVAGVAAGALVAGGLVLSPAPASADYTYTPIPQSQLSLVEVNSFSVNEGTNGAGALALDGNKDTYWHTEWQPTVVQPPHHITVKLADQAIDLGRVTLTPRQSSNGSGRAHDYELWTANGDCTSATYTRAASGSFSGLVDDRAKDQVITLENPVAATCAKVVYLSSWGGHTTGDTTSRTETVASLAEFNASTASGTAPTATATPTVTPTQTATPGKPEIVVPQGAVEIADGSLKVRLHPGFPQVVDYRLGDKQLAGRLGDALNTVLINEVSQPVTVTAPVKAGDGKSATYKVTFPNLPKVSFDAVASVKGDVFTLTFTNIVDPDNEVNRIRIPGHNLVTVTSDDAASQLTAGRINVDRASNADSFDNIAATAAGAIQGSYMVVANNSVLAAALDTNATEDNTAAGESASRVSSGNNRFQRQIVQADGYKAGSAYAGTWTWLSQAVETKGGATSIGRDADPYVEVKITADANSDSTVDWQDAAIALRSIVPAVNGGDAVKNQVIARIPFNIVSQATHPFLRTLDDTKRISLATDNLGQKAMLKGYQAEGHDSAHPDYADHYNTRAGGLDDLKTLANEGKNWNTTFGVHVNATESYSEAHAFSEDLLQMPPKAAWGWMNQSYSIDGPKDLATNEVLKRFKKFQDEVPENLRWLYVDVYYPQGWEMERFARELSDQGWTMSTEWSDRMPAETIWSHWSQEENYGGSTNKGLNSQLMRFVYNSKRDTWNPQPILGNTNLVDFEGWTGHVDYNAFITNVWQRNLPTKFLQQSDIVKWESNKITFANGTVATSPLSSINGTTVPNNRTINYDGATVFDQGKYLLPWKDGGADRLYHFNTTGGTSTWTLTDSWKSQTSLKLFKLTDTGRVEVGTVTPTAGKVTLTVDANTAYVLYPTSAVPAAKAPNWGQGSLINDPGFFSGSLNAYAKTGDVSVVTTDRANFQAQFGSGAASLSQDLTLPAGTYSAWAWVEIEKGKTRDLTVSASGAGVTKAGYSEVANGAVSNTISASTVLNATASDEKLDTNFQRVRVTFTTDGSSKVTFAIKAGDGTAKISVDDLRVVKYTPAKDTAPTTDTIFFEDFEGIDTGYFPFVTGATNAGGDARTQLAEKHAPYSQKGWYGINDSNKVVAGGKLNDNVLTGNWSLMANNENTGEILKTSPGAIAFKAGHKYKVSFDYQTTHAGQYRVRMGGDSIVGGAVKTTNQVSDLLPLTLNTTTYSETFDASCGAAFVAIDKLSGANTQHNMTIDNMRVEDLGASSSTCIDGAIATSGAVAAGGNLTVTTTVTAISEALTDVKHALALPEGWTSSVTTPGATTLAVGAVSTQVWKVTAPATAVNSTIGFTGSGTASGKTSTVERSASITVTQPLPAGETYLSDMQDRVVGTPTNGWGPVEWDMSNGEQGAGDGGPLKIGGVTFPKGIGTHADASITFDLEGKCTAFKATVGINDIQPRGSVTFIVQGDGKELARTAEITGTSTPRSVDLDVDITGVKQLTLISDKGAANGNDHADWALARVDCGADDTTAPVIEKIADQSGKVGDSVELKVLATDESLPLSYAATGLPAGLSIDASTGVISGKLATAAVSEVSVSVTDAKDNKATTTFTFTVTAAPTPTTSPKPGFVPSAPYTLPGIHEINGRLWFTQCEAYSQTKRCRTDIWASTVQRNAKGQFVVKQDWAFNNLTYLPYMTRAQWSKNPLGFTNTWKAADGRQWKTECDTAATGRNACRSYTLTTVVSAKPKTGGGYTFTQSDKWVFNNIVMFR